MQLSSRIMRPSKQVEKEEKGSPTKEVWKSWAGDKAEVEENSLMGNKTECVWRHSPTAVGVATDDELQQQFHVDKELRDKVVDTLIWDKQNIF